MPFSSLELFRILAPDLCAETDQRVGQFLEIASIRHTGSVWGAVFQQAMVEYAAHMMLKAPTGASTLDTDVAGPITSERAGGEARTYANSASTTSETAGDRWLMETAHGRQYLHLRKTRAASTPTFIGVC